MPLSNIPLTEHFRSPTAKKLIKLQEILRLQEPSLAGLTHRVRNAICAVLWVTRYPQKGKIANTVYFCLLFKFLIQRKLKSEEARKLIQCHEKQRRLIWKKYSELKRKKNKSPEEIKLFWELTRDYSRSLSERSELEELATDVKMVMLSPPTKASAMTLHDALIHILMLENEQLLNQMK